MIRWFSFIICVSILSSLLTGLTAYSDQNVKQYEERPYNVASGRTEDSAKEQRREGRALTSQEVEEANGPCEVVNFEAYEETQAVLTASGDYKVIARRQCASLKVRNIAGSAKYVDDFVFTVAFGNGNIAYSKFDSTEKDAKKLIPPGDTYNGTTCFEGGSPILILNCAVR
jgi:hypothetical protein